MRCRGCAECVGHVRLQFASSTPSFLCPRALSDLLRRATVDPMVDIADHPRDGAWPQLARARETAILHHSVDRRPSEAGAEFNLRQSDQSSWRLHFIGHVLLQQDSPSCGMNLCSVGRAVEVLRPWWPSLEGALRLLRSAIAAMANSLAAVRASDEERSISGVNAATSVAATRKDCAAQPRGEMCYGVERSAAACGGERSVHFGAAIRVYARSFIWRGTELTRLPVANDWNDRVLVRQG